MAKLQTKYSLSPFPTRRQTRLGSYDYRQAGGYFVTVCAHNRRCLFGAVAGGIMLPNESGRVLIEYWQALPAHFPNVQLDEFVVMPNHFHAILFINDGDVGARSPKRTSFGRIASPAQAIGTNKASLGTIIGAFKSAVTRKINSISETPGVSLWQRNYYEHVIRNDISLAEIREYVTNNPMAWDLDELNPQRARHASPLHSGD